MVSNDLNKVAWFGLGPGESYADKKRGQKVGMYASNVDDLHTPYEVPPESGNRMDTRWLRIGDCGHWGLRVTRQDGCDSVDSSSSQQFSWLATRYSAKAIEAPTHLNELLADDAVYLRLDAESAGVGTGACGPRTLEKYRVKCEEMRFVFRLEPYFGEVQR